MVLDFGVHQLDVDVFREALEEAVIPQRLNWASACANHTSGWEIQKVGSLSDTACYTAMNLRFWCRGH